MKSLPTSFVFLLIVLIAAPLDSAAASWMALGMNSHSSGELTMDSASMASVAHSAHQPVHQHAAAQPVADNSIAAEEDCDEHCMNCSSHCFTSVLIATSALDFPGDSQLSTTFNSRAFGRASPLYRPPIAS